MFAMEKLLPRFCRHWNPNIRIPHHPGCFENTWNSQWSLWISDSIPHHQVSSSYSKVCLCPEISRSVRKSVILSFINFNFRYFLFALAILAVLGVSIWKAAYDKKFVLFLAGIGKMMLLFYIFAHMIGFTVVLYSIIKHNRKQRQPSAPNTSI